MLRDVLKMHQSAQRASEIDKKHLGIQPPRNGKKPIYCTLLIDPEWFKGSSGESPDGVELGGYADAPVEATEAWYRERLKNLRLIEVRGHASMRLVTDADAALTPGSSEEDAEAMENAETWVPPQITLKDGRVISTTAETIARKANGKEWDSHFVCGACGTPQDLRLSIQARTAHRTGHGLRNSGYSTRCGMTRATPTAGDTSARRSAADIDRMIGAEREWTARKDADLNGYWPREELPFTYMTHQANFALPEQGYTHWYKMFNTRQLWFMRHC